MAILLVIFGPMVVAWLFLAVMPRGLPFFVAFAVVFVAFMASALAPLPPSSGPDDWFRGLGRAGASFGLIGAGAVLPAQALRWWRALKLQYYLLALLGFGVLAFVLTTTFGSF